MLNNVLLVMLTLTGEERGGVCHLAAGSGKDFHAGANEKQLIYLLIYKRMGAYGGERVGLATCHAAHCEHPEEKQGSHPRTAVTKGVITSHRWFRRKFSCF